MPLPLGAGTAQEVLSKQPQEQVEDSDELVSLVHLQRFW